ncbi:MAG: hypothetical protein GXP53_07115 [Deltaproteobacteria bacterium]|nr:hypothetical protein [Deltaproteobacteria bacterium]
MYIIDFEASGLSKSSYPIEVAWGSSVKTVASYLLNPDKMDGWTDWNPKSYEFHQIPREKLLVNGKDPRRVAKLMIDDLAGQTAYSDEPRFDNMWKERLLVDSGYDPGLIKIKNLKYFLNKKIKSRFPKKRLIDLFQEFSANKSIHHRAGADVIWLFKFVEFVEDLSTSSAN